MEPLLPSPFGPGNPARPPLPWLFLRFLRYGLLAWGGPVAQIAMMHRELVERDGWIDETRFRKTLALYQALPGPEALELAVYFGMTKRGRWGGLLAGLGFGLPGILLVAALAAAYVHVAAVTTGIGASLLAGVKPAVLALVAVGFVRLARASLDTWKLAAIGLAGASAGLFAPALPFVLLALAAGAFALATAALPDARAPWARAHGLVLLALPVAGVAGLGAIGLMGAKAGLLSFGGAYTALPFLQRDAVLVHGWISNAEFLDAVALSGLVPGPLIAIGTFVGYLAGGLAGAGVVTVAIFAPAFLFTLLGHATFERLVHEPRLHAFLLGVTAAVVGLVLVVTANLAADALVDVLSVAIALGAAAALQIGRWPIPVVLLLAAGVGLVATLAR